MRIKLLSPEDEIFWFKNAKEARRMTGLTSHSIARLKAGVIMTIKGWKSMHSNCRRKVREWRRTSSYVNLETKELLVVSTHHCKHLTAKYLPNIYKRAMSELSRGQRIMTANWVLRTTYELIYGKTEYTRKTFILHDHTPQGEIEFKNANRVITTAQPYKRHVQENH